VLDIGSSIYPLTAVLGGVELRVDSPLVVGCYSMNSTSPAVSTSTTNSIQDCLVQCGPGKLAAVNNGVNCYCFSTFPQEFLLPSTGCNTTCPGNSNMLCGGPGAFSFAIACESS
jgi:hypothetical protein